MGLEFESLHRKFQPVNIWRVIKTHWKRSQQTICNFIIHFMHFYSVGCFHRRGASTLMKHKPLNKSYSPPVYAPKPHDHFFASLLHLQPKHKYYRVYWLLRISVFGTAVHTISCCQGRSSAVTSHHWLQPFVKHNPGSDFWVSMMLLLLFFCYIIMRERLKWKKRRRWGCCGAIFPQHLALKSSEKAWKLDSENATFSYLNKEFCCGS